MAEEDDTALVVGCVSIIIASVGAATAVISSSENKRKRKHKVWTRQYIKQREQFGTYYKLLPELTDSAKFLHYLRMDVHTFDELLNK